MAARDYDGADYFDWSFYSQGTREQGGASADIFVAAALTFFGDPEMAESPTSPWDKGARLAELVARRRALLVLDGLEPLQHPPGPLAGELKDPAITALLKGLSARNPGLCVVTTRGRVADLAPFRDSTAPEQRLQHLATADGVKLLEALGVHGAAADMDRLVEDVKGHALTLQLLGRFLTLAHGGDVRRRDRVELEKADGEEGPRGAGAHFGLAKTCREVERRAAQTLMIGQRDEMLLEIALGHLSLGRARLYRAILELHDPADAAGAEIEQAVDGLRRAGTLDQLPHGLLTDAWLRALTGDADGARHGLDEAAEIAERGPMPLHQADVHLHRARLFRDRQALAEARRLIEKHGYGRRREELADAEEAAKHLG